MKKNSVKIIALVLAGLMALSTLFGVVSALLR
jgi:hypothetical protein